MGQARRVDWGSGGKGGSGTQTPGGAAGMSGQAGEGGGAPECVDSEPPRCKNAAMSETCSHGAWQATACASSTPACLVRNPAMGDFHLTNVGKSAIPKTASRASDDPAVDIDGEARKPSDGYPGLDEP